MDFIVKVLILNKIFVINMICFVYLVFFVKRFRLLEYFYCYIVDYYVKISCFFDFDVKFFWYMINFKMFYIEL